MEQFTHHQLEIIGLDFLQRTEVNKETNCWVWNGARWSNNRYGQMTLPGFKRAWNVHRISAAVFLDFDINSNLLVCHKCDNGLCCNPDHLFIGNNQDNSVDMVNKGRQLGMSKTHCPRNHEYTPENTYIQFKSDTGKPTRSCRACRDIARTASRQRQRGN